MTEMDLAQARYYMIEQQVRTWEVLDQRVLDVLERLPREDFVSSRYRHLAYADMQLPLAEGEVMMEPKLEGRMLQALNPQPGDTALEIGTGSGYVTACLGALAGEVVSVDRLPGFHELGAEHTARQGIANVRFEMLDAAMGKHDGQRYDVIALTGSLPQLHKAFHESLTVGGRLFVIVGTAPIMEALLITRVAENQWATESLFDTSIRALVGAPHTRRFEL